MLFLLFFFCFFRNCNLLHKEHFYNNNYLVIKSGARYDHEIRELPVKELPVRELPIRELPIRKLPLEELLREETRSNNRRSTI